MNDKKLSELESKINQANYLKRKINEFDKMIEAISGDIITSVWVGEDTLVNFPKTNLGCDFDNGIGTKKEAKELSNIIKEYLINIIENYKKPLVKKLDKLLKQCRITSI